MSNTKSTLKYTNIIQFLTFAAVMASMIFIPVLASEELGASKFEVGMIFAGYGLAIFFSSYIFGRASDMHGRRIFIKLGLLAAAVFYFLQIFADSVLLLIILRILAGFGSGIFPAALTAYVYESKGRLGKFSAYGSLGWAFGSLITVVIALETFKAVFELDFYNLINFYNLIFISSSVMFFIAFLFSLRLRDTKITKLKIPFFPAELIKENFSLYLSYFLRHTGANAVWMIFPLYLLELGANNIWIGIIYFINSGMQFLIMRRVDKFKSKLLITAGLGVSILVFIGFGAAQNFYQIIPVQFMLAVSWSCLYVGSLLFLTERNIEKATSVGILNSIIYLCAISGPLIGGIVAEFLGMRAVMFVGAGLSLVGYLVFKFRK